jgi:hypothetical protein
MQENKRGARDAKGAKTTGSPRRASLWIAMTSPAAFYLEANRKANSLSMSFSAFTDPERSGRKAGNERLSWKEL